MPVVAGAPLLLLALLVLALVSMMAHPMMRPLIGAIAEKVPLIGRQLSLGAIVIADLTQRAWDAYVQPQLDPLVGWLDGIAKLLRALPAEIVDLARTVANRFEHLTTVEIPAMVDAMTGATRTLAINAYGRTTRILDDVIPRVETEWRAANTIAVGIAAAAQGAALDLRDHVLPNLRRDVERDIAKVRDRVDGLVIPNVDGIRADVDKLKGMAGEVPAYLRDVLPWLTTAAGAVTVATVVDGATTAYRARHKIDKLCTLDLDDFDDLLDFLPVLMGAGAIIAGIEVAARNAEPVLDMLGNALDG